MLGRIHSTKYRGALLSRLPRMLLGSGTGSYPRPLILVPQVFRADGASAVNATLTLTIPPPASMLAGDLVAVICQSRVSSTWSVGVTGGQTWTSETAFSATLCFCRIFWCRFNGTWGANPRFDCTSATCTTAVMHVFRPVAPSWVWTIDVAQASTTFAAPSTPFTVTRSGLTTSATNTVTLAIWATPDDCSWTSLAGTGWVVTGSAQYRNTSGSDQSLSFARHIDGAASSVVPNVSKNQTTVTGVAGITAIITWDAAPGALTLTLADTVVMSDLRTGAAGYGRSLPDPMTLAETLARIATYLRSLADPFALGETVVPFKPGGALSKSVAEPIALAEALARVTAWQRSLAEPSMTINETLAKATGFTRSRIDPLTMGEALVKFFQKGITNPIVLSEAISKQILVAFSRSLADPMAINEVLAKQAQLQRAIADLITMAEALQKILVLVRNISNSMTMGEVVGKSATLKRSQADPLPLNEALAKMLAVARSFADSMTMSEALAKSATFRRSLADVMTLADTGTRNVLRQLLADPITMGEVVVRTKIFLRVCADLIMMGDAVIKLVVLLRIFSDSISLGERLIRLMAYHRLPVDTISLGEVFAKVASYKRAAADALSLGEALNGISAFRIAAHDLIDLGEVIEAATLLHRTQSDPITLADVVNTRFITFAPAGARRPYNIGTGGVPCP